MSRCVFAWVDQRISVLVSPLDDFFFFNLLLFEKKPYFCLIHVRTLSSFITLGRICNMWTILWRNTKAVAQERLSGLEITSINYDIVQHWSYKWPHIWFCISSVPLYICSHCFLEIIFQDIVKTFFLSATVWVKLPQHTLINSTPTLGRSVNFFKFNLYFVHLTNVSMLPNTRLNWWKSRETIFIAKKSCLNETKTKKQTNLFTNGHYTNVQSHLDVDIWIKVYNNDGAANWHISG